MKIQILFCVYNLQIIHDAEKQCTAIKGWHSKILRLQNSNLRPTVPPPPHHHHRHTHIWISVTVTQSMFLQMHEIKSIIWPKMQSKHRHQGRGYTLKHQEYKTDIHTHLHTLTDAHTHTHTHTHTHNTLLYTQMNWCGYNNMAKLSQNTQIRGWNQID